jgi:hypothetical protein
MICALETLEVGTALRNTRKIQMNIVMSIKYEYSDFILLLAKLLGVLVKP